MKKIVYLIGVVLTTAIASCSKVEQPVPTQFVTMSLPTYNDMAIEEVASSFDKYDGGERTIGVGKIVSYLAEHPDTVMSKLKKYLHNAERLDLPVIVELDGINYWQAHPELWNWWMPDKEGYNPDNRKNVEWSSWSPDDAVKIGWRNWGSQHRVLPMPNLSSPAYRAECFKQLDRLVPVITEWWNNLPENKKYLLIGVQVGVEVSIGANNWYYPNGNDLYDKPAKDDPKYGLNHKTLPDRGAASIGYAAVRTAGIADSGELTEWQVYQAVDDYAQTMCKHVSELGIPRDRLFMHAGGWKEGESIFWVAMNKYSCPNWSFYTYAPDPRKETTAMAVLGKSEAPYWGIGEWMLFHNDTVKWRKALNTVLDMPKLRYVQIRHWGSIRNKPEIVSMINDLVYHQK